MVAFKQIATDAEQGRRYLYATLTYSIKELCSCVFGGKEKHIQKERERGRDRLEAGKGWCTTSCVKLYRERQNRTGRKVL